MRMKRKVKVSITIITIIGLSLIFSSIIYTYLQMPVDKNSKNVIEVVVEPGMTSREVGNLLKEKKLIKDSKFFLLYVKFNKCNSLKATTYNLSKNMSLDEIVSTICKGNSVNKDIIKVTFKEGKTVSDFADTISTKFNINYNEVINVMNDKNYLKGLINDYWFLTDDILNNDIYYPLEGYLAPDTYEFNKNSTVEEIIEVLLDQTANNLVDYKDKIEQSGKTTHQYLTLASMAELEGLNSKDRKMIVGVFNNRINKGMNLGSDVTTYYALQKKMTSDLTVEEFAVNNPYNTRSSNMTGKLPIGPICNVSKVSIDAAINPTVSNYLYFVADKNGKIYYNTTNEEHLQTVKEIKEAGNWIW